MGVGLTTIKELKCVQLDPRSCSYEVLQGEVQKGYAFSVLILLAMTELVKLPNPSAK